MTDSDFKVHLAHCNIGEHVGSCKYGPAEDCPVLSEWAWLAGAYVTSARRRLEDTAQRSRYHSWKSALVEAAKEANEESSIPAAGKAIWPFGDSAELELATAIRYTERLAAAEAVSSVGSKGDSYDNALAESVIGLYKAELIARAGPWRSLEQVELATAGWVDFWNTTRLHTACGDVPPAEYETAYHSQLQATNAAA